MFHAAFLAIEFAENAINAQPKRVSTRPRFRWAVVNRYAYGTSLRGQILALRGVSLNSIVFADRPIRAAARALTADLLEEWAARTT